MTNACITIDGGRYLLDLPNERCVAKMNERLHSTFKRLFFAKVRSKGTNWIDIIDYRSVYLSGGTQPPQTSVGFASTISKFTERIDDELLPGKNTADTVYLPVLVPLSQAGEIQPISDQDWSEVKGGTLYQGNDVLPPPITDNPIDASPVGEYPMYIGDTCEDFELEWYIVGGILLAKHPICRCKAKALWAAGIGTPWEGGAHRA